MTTPVRWSSPDSDVDPVVRSVLRYARVLTPSHANTQALLARLEATAGVNSTPKRGSASLRAGRPFSFLRIAAVVFALGGAAFAAVVGVEALRKESRASVQADSQPMSAPKADELQSAGTTSPVANAIAAIPAPSGVSVEALPRSEPNLGPPTAIPPALAPSNQGNRADEDEDDATLLHRARAALGSSPYRALTFAQQHAKRFPSSPLAEERAALQVEALFRLGRIEEAKRARAAFEAHFPNSMYRRRLRDLGPQ